MGKLFGTDGIRGIANLELTPELAYNVGRAAGFILSKNKKGKILVGRDTRLSGHLLESALASGIMSIGLDVEMAGVIPTPGIAYLTRKSDYLAGVVISASHNPFEYNGIKFFSSEGYKLPDELENQIEDLIFSDTKIYKNATGVDVGNIIYSEELQDEYENYLIGLSDLNLSNMKIAIDVGNGALYKIAPKVLRDLGAEVIVVNNAPDGTNINDNCGSTNPDLISKLVVETKADMGMSFDGDADRIIAVDEKGNIIDGDHILAICATQLKIENRLKNDTVVGTIMSNIGLKRYLKDIGVKLVYTQVGDRYVLEEMQKDNYVLGGEQSGHIIFLDYNTTGDGLATGIHLLEVMSKSNKKLSELNNLMKSYPQVLVNANVRSDLKNKYMEFEDIKNKIDSIEEKFKGNGRVVIRPSGTESLVRVMIEGEDEEVLQREAEELAKLIEKKLN
ncbi:phosphoglucosamine mutase [Anaerosphaera aminiphila DSM 21120]|uniref:Phosphoglucosamine mutase n=1 Tax=Anaerosphaera aminiphila DSM 21120 TaxID=1120995 RepID=A0A1M5RZ24_9FIRM|nr:phosphoglucosamine mutase [Anaerosphaera aminiphila]SHH31475.1 phosphoglucosamine mutase [Anaerosphaera aminiphila DSM 21120]